MKRKLYSVWFDDAANKVHTPIYYDDDDDDASHDDANTTTTSDTWFSFDDLTAFKLASVKRALKIRTESNNHCYATTLVHVYLSCLNGGTPPPLLLYKLSQLALAHRRGLEFQSMPPTSVRMERAKQRCLVRRAVVQMAYLNNTEDEIRCASEQLSHSARVFARALGQADAMAAGTMSVESLSTTNNAAIKQSSLWDDEVISAAPEKVAQLPQTDDCTMTATRDDDDIPLQAAEERSAALPTSTADAEAALLLQRAVVAS